MRHEQKILESHYTQGKPFVRAKIVVVNPETLRQITIQKDFWIDTGFDGGIHVAHFHKNEITMIGIALWSGTIGIAGGARATAHRCLAYLQKIEDHEFPLPGIEAELILHGSDRHGLLGLDILKHWIVEFDGPNQFFKVASGFAQAKK